MMPSTPAVVAPVPHEASEPAAAQQAAAAASADRLTVTVPLTVALPAAPRGANPSAAAESAAPPRRAALSVLTSILRERARQP